MNAEKERHCSDDLCRLPDWLAWHMYWKSKSADKPENTFGHFGAKHHPVEKPATITDMSTTCPLFCMYTIRTLQNMIAQRNLYQNHLWCDPRFGTWRLVFAFLRGLDGQNRQSPIASIAIPQFHVERMLNECTPIARFESQRNERRVCED